MINRKCNNANKMRIKQKIRKLGIELQRMKKEQFKHLKILKLYT